MQSIIWRKALAGGRGGIFDVVNRMMVSGTGRRHEGLAQPVDVFPAPIHRVRRLAESAATLATEKMRIPAKRAGHRLPFRRSTSRGSVIRCAIE